MSTQTSSFIQSLLPAAVLAAATVAGWYFLPPQLQSDRPGGELGRIVDPSGTQTLDARLWQDPFEPLQSIKEKIKPEWLERLTVVRGNLEASGADCAVLLAMVKNDGTADDAETRRRSRVALLSALGVGNYVPTDANHVGWFALPWERANLGLDPSGIERGGRGARPDLARPLLAAYEWLEPAHRQNFVASRDFGHLLIVWLNEDDFMDHPIARLAQLANALGRSREIKKQFALKLFGPRTSTGLVALCEEATAEKGWVHPQPLLARFPMSNDTSTPAAPEGPLPLGQTLNGLEIYSTWATVADALLAPYEIRGFSQPNSSRPFALVPERDRGRRRLTRELARLDRDDSAPPSAPVIEFHNLTCTDDQLMAAVRREMHLRSVVHAGWDEPDKKVLLLSEWHSDYGRALPLTFAAAFFADRTPRPEAVRDAQANPSHYFSGGQPLIKISYVSGVDGQLPSSSGNGSGKKESDDSSGSAHKDATAEIGGLLLVSDHRPEGNSQLDYLERWTTRLRDDARTVTGGIQPVAVGVLGSDVYDKLILLRALRPQLPEAFFFTTDLDSRLVQPRLASFTGNLLVASTYGFEVPPYIPAPPFTLAPFRDAYQTALHVAARLSLNRQRSNRANSDPGEKDLERAKTSLQPHLFEIGRTEAVELKQKDECGDEVPPVTPDPALANQQPQKGQRVTLAAVVSLILILLVPARIFARRAENRSRKALAATGVAVLAFYWVHLVKAYYPLDLFLMPLAVALLAVALWLKLGPSFGPEASPPRDADYSLTAVLSLSFGLLMVVVVEYWITVWVTGERGLIEPLRWLEGVSLWPTELVRFLAGGLSIFWLSRARLKMKRLIEEVTKEFRLDDKGKAFSPSVRNGETAVIARTHWLDRYGSNTSGASPLFRTAIWAGWLFLIWTYLIALQSRAPIAPARGTFAHVADLTVLGWAVATFTFLTVYVIDLTTQACGLISTFSAARTAWPRVLVDEEAKRRGMEPDPLDGWLDVRFVGKITQVVGRFILYPFIVIALIIVSTNSLFDHWDLHRPDFAVLVSIAALAPIFCGWKLCNAAEKARSAALDELAEARSKVLNLSPGSAKQIEALIEEVKECQTGAFKPFWEQPYVLALLIPLCGSGSVQFAQRILER